MDFSLVVTLAANLLVPVLLVAWMALSHPHSRLEAALVAIVAGACILFLSRVGVIWSWVGSFWPWIFGALYLVALVLLIVRVRRLPWAPAGGGRAWTTLLVLAVVALIFVVQNARLIGVRRYDGTAIALAFPLRHGRFQILQGGSSPLLNRHYGEPAQRYALDIVALTARGVRAEGLRPDALPRYAIYNRPVFAPCAGEVLATRDGLADDLEADPDPDQLAGNYVTLFCKGDTILLAHLRNGTVAVGRGDQIAEGQMIGHAGSSGNSTEPHLHIQAVAGRVADVATLVTDATPVPMRFNDRFLIRDDIVRN